MSRDKRLNRTQEVDGSSPFSSTNTINHLAEVLAPNENCGCLVVVSHEVVHSQTTDRRLITEG